MARMVAVQIVEVVWTKRSRGAPGATLRNALPRAFPMQALSGSCTIEHYRLVESRAGEFEQKLVKAETCDAIPTRIEDLALEPEKDTLSLGLWWDISTGQPERRSVRNAVRLSPGGLARLVTNGRHSSHSGQFYTQSTYNVAFGDDIAADTFIARPPQHTFSQEADLF
ncbi:MAG TPA: hypothetical protein VKZ18_00395 [Polyangia bacterium]|nr:hypothetical protein [Polyangia bacterium]